jgi:hypothetical protein
MSVVSLKAHFDGQSIQLDEPYELPSGAHLLITVLPVSADDPERAAWADLSADALSRAYGDNEPEYSGTDVIP